MAGGSDDDLLKGTQGEPVTAWVHKDETLAIRLPDGRIVYGADIGWEGVLFAVLVAALNWAVGPAFGIVGYGLGRLRRWSKTRRSRQAV
ncbi:MAG: hypothetical protein ACRDTU_14925 [Micromonosporaceae bacterium]